MKRIVSAAQKHGASACMGDGLNRWPAVHRLDAAHLLRLALEKGTAGARYHGVAEEGIPTREIAEVIGRKLKVPVVGKSGKEASRHFGWLSMILPIDNPVSSGWTQEQLGWKPRRPGLIADLENGAYFKTST
jgi:nucleoside-diphosphate-sugar epimerase